ncbi:MAG: PqiC family protein [Dongiaceae bacterium]
MRRSLMLAVFGPALGLTLALAGCASPNPELYTIAPVPGPVQKGGPQVVALQQIGLARYLERQQIVRSSENYKLDVSANDWWGEPLAAMVSRVLIEELGQRLPQSTVISESGAVSSSPDSTVEVNILRLDLDGAGNLVLHAQASIRSRARDEPVLQSFRFSVRPASPGTQGQVAAISTALGQLADKLAPMIRTGSTVQ